MKASNVIIDQFGKVTLIDFGYCKQIEKERTYTICGTTHSMAPEIFSNKGYSYEVDYYAIGILFFELLDGYN